MNDRIIGSLWVFGIATLGVLACAPEGDEGGERASLESSDRFRQIESGLVPFGDDHQPRWTERAGLQERMAHYAVQGVSIAVIEDHEVAWAKGYGIHRSGDDTPVTPSTLFHAGSTAKPMSAAAALTLVQQGRLDLNEDVNDRLLSWRIPDSEFTQEQKVTLRRLLSHSGGLEDGFTNRSAGDAMPEYFTRGGVAPSVAIQQLLTAEPGIDVDGPTRVTATPGSRYRYSNADYAILELLIRDVTGKPFSVFMRETILDPLGMSSSTFEQPLPPDLRPRAAVEHNLNGEPVVGDRLHIPLLAAGGLWTTPSNMARFLVELMEIHQGAEGRLLTREMVAEMFSKQIEIPDNPLAEAVGLGFELSGEGRELYVVHTGNTWGSRASLDGHFDHDGPGSFTVQGDQKARRRRARPLAALARIRGSMI